MTGGYDYPPPSAYDGGPPAASYGSPHARGGAPGAGYPSPLDLGGMPPSGYASPHNQTGAFPPTYGAPPPQYGAMEQPSSPPPGFPPLRQTPGGQDGPPAAPPQAVTAPKKETVPRPKNVIYGRERMDVRCPNCGQLQRTRLVIENCTWQNWLICLIGGWMLMCCLFTDCCCNCGSTVHHVCSKCGEHIATVN